MSWLLGDYAGKDTTEEMQQPLATYR
jgi:hypothetical protein